MMTTREAVALSGRSERWLRSHSCSWCGQSALNALRYGCGAIFEKCEPANKDYGTGRINKEHDHGRS